MSDHNDVFCRNPRKKQSLILARIQRLQWRAERFRISRFIGRAPHYLFEAKFGRPGKGNDKGMVEGLVGYARRDFLVPVPRAANWQELNVHLAGRCRKRRERRLWGPTETIAERFEPDREKLLPLPAQPVSAVIRACFRPTCRARPRVQEPENTATLSSTARPPAGRRFSRNASS